METKDCLKKLFFESFRDSDGSFSSKRLVTFLSFMCCMIGFLANLFWDVTIEQFMFDSMMYISIIGLGTVATEKFAPKSITK